MSIERYDGEPEGVIDFILGSMQEKAHAARTPIVSLIGEPYLPSSGTEGHAFEEEWCGSCNLYRILKRGDEYEDCMKGHIMGAWAAAPDVKDPLYPKAWVYDAEGRPSCSDWLQRTVAADEKPAPLCAGALTPDQEHAAYLRAMKGE